MSFKVANASTAQSIGLQFEELKLLTFDIDKMLSKRKRCVPAMMGSVVHKKRRLHSNSVIDNYTDEECEDMLTCPVCIEFYSTSDPLKEPIFLRCHHTACYSCTQCIKKQLQPKCPLCRASVGNSSIMQKNFYLINFMKIRRVDKKGCLVSWCNDCKGIAKEQCSAHTLQHMPESICHLSGIQSHMRTSLSGILEDETLAYSNSFDMKAADTLLSKAFLELSSLLTGFRSMLASIDFKESIIRRQFSEIQDKMESIEPFGGFEADTAGTSGSTFPSTSALPDNLLTKVRCYTHENQIKTVYSLQDSINILTIVEECMNTALNNRKLLHSMVAFIDTDSLSFAIREKVQTFLELFEQKLVYIRDFKVKFFGEDELQAPPVKSPSFRCLPNDYERLLSKACSKYISPHSHAVVRRTRSF